MNTYDLVITGGRVIGPETVIDAACMDAAAALLAAELIDEANLAAVEAVIHKYNHG